MTLLRDFDYGTIKRRMDAQFEFERQPAVQHYSSTVLSRL